MSKTIRLNNTNDKSLSAILLTLSESIHNSVYTKLFDSS